ncbi:tudor domain-containing protein 7-like isoform X1 [Schistocerca gregaria]|uniref:tudor domain-containing protein 7-like isoform X1 n=1 Tax=Schistocerca gregaria TaxID=7010 RepID=UPI00211F26D8|nr:tudor domain-containing protein 7-like isoform X1 [Schistocerca gregaria]XP_049858625.1 tudor domain-containing protein 7-like isoform X1 [Schistocerca gregaria]
MVDRRSVVENLRACLLSIKGGISVKALDRDYRTLVGHSIPYRELGYSSLEHFLQTVEDMRIFTGSNGELMFDTIPKENTAHLAALVAKQKSAPKKLKFPLKNAAPSRSRNFPPGNKWNSKKPESKPSSRRQPITVTLSGKGAHSNNQSNSVVRTVQSSWTPGRPDNYEKPPRFSRGGAIPSPQPTDAHIPSLFDRAPPLYPESHYSLPTTVDRVPYQSAAAPIVYEEFYMPQQPITQLCESFSQCEVTPSVSTRVRPPITPAQPTAAPVRPPHTPARPPVTPPMTHLKETLRKARNKVQPSVIIESFLPRRGSGSEKLYTDKLREYAVQQGLGEPSYKLVPRKPKGEPFVYSCVVKVGDENFNNYPDEKSTPEEAAESVAKLAVLELTKLNKSLSAQSGTTTDRNVIIRRVSQIVKDYESGLFITQVPVEYTKRHSESLPDNWEKIISNCPTISMDTIAGKTILWPVQASQETQQQTTFQPQTGSTKVEKQAVPPLIEFPADKIWDVYVTSAVSTDEVWVRLIGEMYSDRFEKMASEMEDFYSQNKMTALNLRDGSFYAIESDDCWHRVELLEVNGDEASVYYIDHGDEDTVPCDKLCVLDPQFAALPQQAVVCSLAGMEEFRDEAYAVSLLEKMVIGGTFVAEVEPNAEKVALVLFDTSTDEDVNMNQLLSNKIRQHQFTPELPQVDTVKDVFISSIAHNGDVHIQMSLKPLDYITSQIQSILEAAVNEYLPKASEVRRKADDLYLAPYASDNSMYRAKIVEEYPATNEADIIFVDYGNVERARLDSLILLENVDDELKNIPYQAIKVNMHNLPSSVFNEKVANRLLELVPQTDTVLMKVITPGTDTEAPTVELFKRFTDEKLLVSINNTLALDPDLIRSSETSSGTDLQRKKRAERSQSVPSTGKSPDERYSETGVVHTPGIPPPLIPKVNTVFDIHVTMASNPSNFMVQAYENLAALDEMMDKLQERYNEIGGGSVPQSIVEGEFYAVLHSDQLWYRGKVISVMSDSVISVYFCDYGDVSVLSREKFRLLADEFKTLPHQAIKAKLCAVKPIHGDWSVEDCLLFQSLVVEKQFPSLVLDTGPDIVNPHDTVLGLKLIDTSGEKDFCIDDLLVNQNRAVLVSKEHL